MATCFVLMQRNSTHLSEYFRLPSDSLVEIGRQISILSVCSIIEGEI